MSLTTIARVQSVRPPSKGGAFADDPILLARVTDCLNSASKWFEDMVGRDINQTARDYILDGNGTRVLTIKDWPILFVASVLAGGMNWNVFDPHSAAPSPLSDQQKVDTSQPCYVNESRRYLVARYSFWPVGFGNVLVNATSGYATIPDDVQQCVSMLTWLLLEETNRIGITSSTLGQERIGQLARSSKDYDFLQRCINYYGRQF